MIKSNAHPFLLENQYPRFRNHLCIICFFLLVAPGNSLWSREEYLDSGGTPFEPVSPVDSLSAEPRAVSADFISREQLQEFDVQMANLHDRLGGVDHSTVIDDEFRREIDVIFRMHKGIHSNRSVLNDGVVQGRRINRRLMNLRRFSINQPFVESIPLTASSIRKFAYSIANGTLRPGDKYAWPGGRMTDFNLTRHRVKRLTAYCSELKIDHVDRETRTPFRTENITWIIRRAGVRRYLVYIYPAERGSPLCSWQNGDSLFFKDHGNFSQRLLRFESDHLQKTSFGKIEQDDLNLGNPGNVFPKIIVVNSVVFPNKVYFPDIQKAVSDYDGTQKWMERKTLWLQAEDAFEQSLAAYNNSGFLFSQYHCVGVFNNNRGCNCKKGIQEGAPGCMGGRFGGSTFPRCFVSCSCRIYACR